MILITKFIFAYYLYENFVTLSSYDIVYAIFWGIKFDLAIASIITLLVSLLDFHKKSLIIISIVGIVFIYFTQISDIFYFYESSRHMGYEVTDAITDAGVK